MNTYYQVAKVTKSPAERYDGPKDHPTHWYDVAKTPNEFADFLNDLDDDVMEVCFLCSELGIKSSNDFWLRILDDTEHRAWNKHYEQEGE